MRNTSSTVMSFTVSLGMEGTSGDAFQSNPHGKVGSPRAAYTEMCPGRC